MKNAESVKDRLRNISKKTGKTYQQLLMEYGIERTVQRIAVSKYADHFTLKGGMLLYALFDGVYPRVTTDIDFLAERLSNSIEDMTMIFREIFSYEADDPLVFRLDTMKVIPITEFNPTPRRSPLLLTKCKGGDEFVLIIC